MITVRTFMTADNTDVLDGTDLDSMPGGGLLVIRAASTQNDTLLTITAPNQEAPIRARAMILRANAEIRLNEDEPYVVGMMQGGHAVIAIDVVTAATVQLSATFIDGEDLAAGFTA